MDLASSSIGFTFKSKIEKINGLCMCTDPEQNAVTINGQAVGRPLRLFSETSDYWEVDVPKPVVIRKLVASACPWEGAEYPCSLAVAMAKKVKKKKQICLSVTARTACFTDVDRSRIRITIIYGNPSWWYWYLPLLQAEGAASSYDQRLPGERWETELFKTLHILTAPLQTSDYRTK